MLKILVIAGLMLWALPARALEIIVSVNEDIITDMDVTERVQLLEEMFQMPANRTQVTEALIDEKVKRQAAATAGISLSDDEVIEGVSYLEKQNNLKSGALEKKIKEKKLSMDSLKNQIEADLLWLKYVQHQDLKRSEVSDKEVEAERNKMRERMKEPTYLLAEIYIPFDGNEAAAEQKAQSLFDEIVGGASFTDLAVAHSKGKTASEMGDLGWVRPKQLEKAVDDVLPQMKAGQLSRPIKGKKGYTILLMRDSQPALDSDMQEVIQVTQMVVEKSKIDALASDLNTAKNSCMSFTQFATKNGVPGSHSGALPEMMVGRMPFELKSLIDGKSIGELVGPVEMGDYALYVMKCGSRVMSVLPDKDTIRSQIQMQKMEREADKLLTEARAKMTIEKKKK